MAPKPKRIVRALQSRGNGLALPIPREVCKRLAWNMHDAIAYDVIDGHLVLTKVPLPKVDDLRLVEDEQVAS